MISKKSHIPSETQDSRDPVEHLLTVVEGQNQEVTYKLLLDKYFYTRKTLTEGVTRSWSSDYFDNLEDAVVDALNTKNE